MEGCVTMENGEVLDAGGDMEALAEDLLIIIGEAVGYMEHYADIADNESEA